MSKDQLSHATYNALMECENNIIEKAAAVAVFHETDESGFEFSPIVIIESEKDLGYWNKKIQEWHRYAQMLQLAAPSKFPKNSRLFNPAPLIVTGVESCLLANVEAVSSQPIKKERILKILKSQLSIIQRNKRLMDMGEDVEIKDAIQYFSSRNEENYRLRRTGYTCLRTTLTMSDGSRPLQMVPHRGLFLYSGNPDVPVKFSRANEGSKPRQSAFDLLTPIPHSIGLVGDLYAQSEVDRAKAEMDHIYAAKKAADKARAQERAEARRKAKEERERVRAERLANNK